MFCVILSLSGLPGMIDPEQDLIGFDPVKE